MAEGGRLKLKLRTRCTSDMTSSFFCHFMIEYVTSSAMNCLSSRKWSVTGYRFVKIV